MADRLELLSVREKEALRLLLEGHDAKSIARELAASIHSVNERLRSARQKLGVTSSREAARLLGQSEQSVHKLLGNNLLGLSDSSVSSNKDGGRCELPRPQRPVVLVLRGMLLMAIIVAAVMLTWTIEQKSTPERPARWSHIKDASDHGSEVRNLVHLDGNRLSWNGSPITETILSQYLDITTYMSPQPTLVLSYSAETKATRIQAIRSIIEDVLQCTPRNCKEVALTAAR